MFIYIALDVPLCKILSLVTISIPNFSLASMHCLCFHHETSVLDFSGLDGSNIIAN